MERLIMEDKTNWAIQQLQEKARVLERPPKKNDFDETTLSRIKAYLGPWPRALEQAGLKEKQVKETTGKKHRRNSRRGESKG